MRKILKYSMAIINAIRAMVISRNKLKIGVEFDRYGRRLGIRLLRSYPRMGLNLIVDPLSLTRYFEFPFTAESVSQEIRNVLDLSSPRLFSLWLSEYRPDVSITMMNPDDSDIRESERIANALKLSNIRFITANIELLLTRTEEFDLVYSISVVEHICGEYDDKEAVKLLYQTVRPGGKMIITVPVDREFWSEYRDHDPYGTQEAGINGRFFFQHYYDLQTLQERIIDSVGIEPCRVAWFGELNSGHLQQYETDWRRSGVAQAARDPEYIARFYGVFDNWQKMPGKGVCGLVFEKPNSA